ncbi:hypothetical protein MNBD_GAMMA24-826 [hydrothermal vent metagenome]|uniref:DUF2232 domain-containing protein n=1 Tax=hydrothermal vent metagenome TaxID=652676 RepID=A0A3B1BS10_9ZZZZ
MKGLAAYVMRGRLQALLIASGLLPLALMLMPLSWPLSFFSAAVVGLVTLVQGVREGLLVLLGGCLVVSLLGLLIPGNVFVVIGFALLAWLPVWFLALVLRQTVSLNLSLLLGALLGIIAVGSFFLFTGDPATWWYQHFIHNVLPVLEKAGMVFNDRTKLEAELLKASHLMTGSLAAFMLLGAVAGLFIARRWQASLYNPGGFQSEFYQLRFGVTPALVALALLAAALLGPGLLGRGLWADLLVNILSPVVVVFLFQGLAIGHVLIKARGRNSAWLVGMYMLLLFGLPYSPVLLALLGMFDNWLDLRTKFGGQNTGGRA